MEFGELVLHLLFVLVSVPFYVAADYQGDALFEMREKLISSESQLPDWNPNHVNPCTWSAVICDGDNRVTSVTLSSMELNGTLSSKIGVLKFLKTLSLPGNRITGTIPVELGNLTSLESLNFENNRLSGEIPSSLGNLSKLRILILSQNNLSGGVPDSFTKLTSLTDILLAYNDLSGKIPDHLFDVAKYNFTGNNLQCGENFSHSCVSRISEAGTSHSSKVGVLLGSIGGVGAFVILVISLLILRCRRQAYQSDVFVDVSGLASNWKPR